MAIAERYVDDVTSGRTVACGWLRKAAQRYRKMRRRADEPGNGFIFSADHANDVCDFAEKLPHIEGRWSSETIQLEPWQVFVLVACYGFRNRRTDRRLVTVIYFQVSRKSAKSTLVVVMAIYHLVREREPGAQVIFAATTGQQARIAFSIAQRMIRRSAWLREQGLQVFAHSITLDATGGFARPINSKSSTQDGLNPSFICLDESHAQTFQLRDVLVSAMGARDDGLIVCPTTAGYDLTSVGYALRTTATKILDEVIESDHTFAVLYELDEADDWRDESVWIKAAPMIGITPSLDYVRRYRDDAIATPGMQGEFEVKVCNRWLHSSTSWLSMAAWDRCADASLTLDSFRGKPAYVGVDLAERDDIAAVAICFRQDGLIYAFVRGYLPALVVNERARAVPEYRLWAQSGELVMTDGDLTDYGTIESDIRDLCKRFDVQNITIERYGALNLASNLAASGLPALVESKNAKVFTPPAKELEARVKTLKFRHTGSTFLKWAASNCCLERRRDGSILTMKDRAESPNKIDAIDAILLGMSAMLAQPAEREMYQFFVLDAAAR